MSLAAGGCALIYVPHKSAQSNMAQAIHLFSQFFTRTSIIHTLAGGRTYICGIDRDMSCSPKSRLVDFAGRDDQDIFTPEYMVSESFVNTVNAMRQAHDTLREIAIADHKKALAICAEVSGRAGLKLFGGLNSYLESKYKDYSDEWARDTGFDLLDG
jgi:hypothetical protein